MTTPQAIVIGLPSIATPLAGMCPQWDFAQPAPDIATFWEGLTTGAVDNNLQVVFITDNYFDLEGKDESMEKLIATMGPYCLFMVVHYRQERKDGLLAAVRRAAGLNSFSTPIYQAVDPNAPRPTIDLAVQSFLRDHPETAAEAAAIIDGRA